MTDDGRQAQGRAARLSELPQHVPPQHDRRRSAARASVWSRLCRRPSARVALGLLAFLGSMAVYAPLIANDRPYYLEAVEVRAYRSALRSLPTVVEACVREVRASAASSESLPSLRARREREAALVRIAQLESALEPRLHAPLVRLRATLDTVFAPVHPGERAAARDEALERAVLEARAIEHLLAPRDADAPAPQPDAAPSARSESARSESAHAPSTSSAAPGVDLRARVRWPLFASLSALEWFAICAWTVLLARPLWRARVAALRARFGSRSVTATLTLAALALGLGLWLASARDTAPRPPDKAGIARGDVLVRRVVFAPLAFGYGETQLAEAWRPPTWSRAARLEEDGRWLRARASDAASLSLDVQAAAPPVVRRPGEAALEAALRHPFGTDGVGRDVLARCVHGARVSLGVSVVAALLLTLIGTCLGALAGWYGGFVDFALSRVIEVVLCFPVLFLVLCVLFFLDPRVVPPPIAVAAVIACVGWTGVARLVRAEFLARRAGELVVAARALGFGDARIVVRHVLPHALSPVLVACAFAASAGILIESTLSFLGLGVTVPVPSWGALVHESRDPAHWWIWLFPGACVFTAVIAFNLLGEALRDVLDPRATHSSESIR